MISGLNETMRLFIPKQTNIKLSKLTLFENQLKSTRIRLVLHIQFLRITLENNLIHMNGYRT